MVSLRVLKPIDRGIKAWDNALKMGRFSDDKRKSNYQGHYEYEYSETHGSVIYDYFRHMKTRNQIRITNYN